MGQPRHHHTHNLLTRWTQMLAAPARAWSVFQQIFAAPWEAFHHAHPRSQTPYYDALVRQLLACGHPLKRGSVEYRCLHGGPGQPLVAMSGTSSRCLRCAKVSTENGVRQVRTVLLGGPDWQHRQRIGGGFAQLLPVHFGEKFHALIVSTASQSRRTPSPGPSGGVRNPPEIGIGVATISRQYRSGPNVSQAYGRR